MDEKLKKRVGEEFEKTSLARAGGTCWEVCDFESICKDMKDFIFFQIDQILGEKVSEIENLKNKMEGEAYQYMTNAEINRIEGFNSGLTEAQEIIKRFT